MDALDRTFDRVLQFDERSRAFGIRATIPAQRKLRSYTWSCPVHLDQGVEGACVGHGWAHEAAARPCRIPVTSADAFAIYRRAQKIDTYPDDVPGTSVLAGAKAVVERGWMREYRWAFSLQDALLTLSWKGPVVVGFNWYEGMFEPDSDGFIRPTGDKLGGHCAMVNAISVPRRTVTVHNSWGPRWGRNGTALLSWDDFEFLQHDDGEVCVPVQRTAI